MGHRRTRSSPFGRAGSKYRLAPWILSAAARIPHDRWGELFAGSCAVTLQKDPVSWEFVNDADAWIGNFLGVLRDKNCKNELLERLEFTGWEERDFESCSAMVSGRVLAPQCPVERARVFLVANSMSYNKSGRTFSVSAVSSGLGKWQHIDANIESMANRIRHCAIFGDDFVTVLQRREVNHPEMLIYVDPPYIGVEKTFYGPNKTDGFDHGALRDRLMDCVSSMIVSYEDHSLVRELYPPQDGWAIEEKQVTRAMGNNAKPATELLLVRLSDWALAQPRRRRLRAQELYDESGQPLF